MKSLLFCVVALSCFLSSANAQNYISPDPVPNWVHQQFYYNDTPQKHGLFLPGKVAPYTSSILVADIDGDPSNGLEIVVLNKKTELIAMRADGSIMWTFQIKDSSCSSLPSPLTSPSVGALYGDGVPYVVVGYGGITNKKCDGGVIAVRGYDGKQQWKFSTKAFNKKERNWAINYGVASTPALADVDGDGKLEVGFGSYDRNVYLLNNNGSIRLYYVAADTIWSSPTFANVDKTPQLEMIIGTDISQNTRIKPPTKNGGMLYAIKTNKLRTKSKKINFRDKKYLVWQVALDQVIQSSPAVADLISSNAGNEVVVGNGCFFPERNKKKKGNWVKVFSANKGKTLRTLKTASCLSSSPTLADIDEDGKLEIIVLTNGSKSVGGDGYSRLIAWKPEENVKLWEVIPSVLGRNDPFPGHMTSPIVADLDGNGSLEVLIPSSGGIAIYAGKTGTALTCQRSDCADNPLLLRTWNAVKSTPAIADVNNDGVLEVVFAGILPEAGSSMTLYGWTNFASVLASEPGLHPAYSNPWGMFRKNSMRNAMQ